MKNYKQKYEARSSHHGLAEFKTIVRQNCSTSRTRFGGIPGRICNRMIKEPSWNSEQVVSGFADENVSLPSGKIVRQLAYLHNRVVDWCRGRVSEPNISIPNSDPPPVCITVNVEKDFNRNVYLDLDVGS
jgi:hypothetical protein